MSSIEGLRRICWIDSEGSILGLNAVEERFALNKPIVAIVG